MSNRILKAPEVRRQEILDTAMHLFRDKGYDATSIADIAKAMDVVPGLCYRYFKNKKEIFNEAVKQYAVESSEDFLETLADHSIPFMDRLEKLTDITIHKEENSRYHDFYHAPGNETFHLQLALEMLKHITPYITKELRYLKDIGQVEIDDPELLTDFILCGQVPIWFPTSKAASEKSMEYRILETRKYICKLLGITE